MTSAVLAFFLACPSAAAVSSLVEAEGPEVYFALPAGCPAPLSGWFYTDEAKRAHAADVARSNRLVSGLRLEIARLVSEYGALRDRAVAGLDRAALALDASAAALSASAEALRRAAVAIRVAESGTRARSLWIGAGVGGAIVLIVGAIAVVSI